MSDELSPPTVEILETELRDVVEWESLSVQLHLGREYEKINADYGYQGTDRCKLELFNTWLKRGTNGTWEHIAAALERMPRRETALAAHLREKYASILNEPQRRGPCNPDAGIGPPVVSVKQSPQKKFVRIQEKFAHLLVQVKMALRECSPPLDPDYFYEYLQPLVPEIQNSSSIDSLYSEVRKHCDFLRFSLIEHITRYDPLKAKTKTNIVMKKKLKRYRRDLEKFKKATEMCTLITAIHDRGRHADKMVSVEVKFQPFLEHIRVNAFVDLLKLIFYDKYKFLVKMRVMTGCLNVHWLIPASICEKLTTTPFASTRLMESVGIIYLKIAETTVYKSGKDPDTKDISIAFSAAIRSQDVAACEFLLYAFHDAITLTHKSLSPLQQDPLSLIELACRHGHVKVVSTLLQLDYYRERTNSTPLMIACGEGHSSIVKLILEFSGAVDVNKQGPYGETALHLSCNRHFTAVVKCLLRYSQQTHLNLDIADRNEMTPLMISVGSGQQKIVHELLKSGANPNATKRKDGDTALHIACYHGYYRIARELLRFNADPHACKTDGWIPLFVAIPDNHIKVVELLLRQGKVDPNTQNEHDGDNALLMASWNNCPEIVRLLLSMGADPNITTNDGWTPLIAASLLGFNDIADTLIKSGARINTQANDGVTGLYVASQEGHSEVVSLLLNQHADIYLSKKEPPKTSTSPLAIACQNGHKNVVELLLEANPTQIDAKNESGATPLFIASYNGKATIVELLLNKGADPFSLDYRKQNALGVTDDNACQELLRKAGLTKSVPAKQTLADRIVSNAKNLRTQLVGKFRKYIVK